MRMDPGETTGEEVKSEKKKMYSQKSTTWTVSRLIPEICHRTATGVVK